MSLSITSLTKRLFQRFTKKAALVYGSNRAIVRLEQSEDRNMPGDGYWALGGGSFFENWTGITRINQDNDWSFIPSIVGYSGTGRAPAPGTDPRTLLADAPEPSQVKANQQTPLQAGNATGVAEFEGVGGNPTVALRADATSAPSLMLRLDSTGVGGIAVSFNLRDLDAVNDAVTQVNVQYRLGESGPWMNAPGGYVADATSAGASQVTPVSVTLPPDANNQAQLQVRILATSSSNQGEWLGVDDIAVTSKPLVSVAKIADATEGGTSGLFRFTRGGDLTQALTVNYTVGGTATPGSDYTALSGSLTFGAGEGAVDVLLVPVDDTHADPNEEMSLTLNSSSNYVIDTTAPVVAQVVDNDSPLVSVVKGGDAAEGGAAGGLGFSRTGATTSALTVNYTITGTATAGSDYTALSGTVTFAVGESSKNVAVAALNDTTAEVTETVVATVTAAAGYQKHPDAIDVVQIADDDTNPGIVGGGVWVDDGDGVRETGEEPLANWAVTLRDGFGGRLFETLTDAAGAYQFRGLAAGTYFVTLDPLLLHWFTTANVGSDESADSDIDTVTGQSGPVVLTSGAMSNLLTDAGITFAGVVPVPVSGSDKIVFTRADGSVVPIGGSLRVAKWNGAFEANAADAADATIPVARKRPQVKGPSAWDGMGNRFDFIDRDFDRFNVRIYDLNAWNTAVPHITATLSTSKVVGYDAYEDTDTAISLSRIPDARLRGWYWSDSQILVSNEVDDRYEDARYLGADDVNVGLMTPTYAKGIPGHATNEHTYVRSDRTHRVALGASVTATYAGLPARVGTVQVEKTVRLHVTILKDKADGAQVVTPASVNADITKMRESYAQVGIRVVIVDSLNAQGVPQFIDAVGAAQVKAPPPGVDLTTMGNEGLDGFAVVNGNIVMTAEEVALLGHTAYRTPADANGKDDIEVYFVNSLKPRAQGESFAPAAVPAAFANSVILAAKHGYTTLAHEAMHVLINSGLHYRVNPLVLDPLDRVNLLVSGSRGIETEVEVIDSRRLTESQGTAMRGTQAALVQ